MESACTQWIVGLTWDLIKDAVDPNANAEVKNNMTNATQFTVPGRNGSMIDFQVPFENLQHLQMTFVAFGYIAWAIFYVCNGVALTLMSVESIESQDAVKVEKSPSADSVAKPGKISTSSLRKTLKLLYARGGYRAYFRGLRFAVLRGILGYATVKMLNKTLPSHSSTFLYSALYSTVVAILTVPLSIAWILSIIGESRRGTVLRYLPSVKKTINLLPATIIVTLLWQAIFEVPSHISRSVEITFEVTDTSVKGPGIKDLISWSSYVFTYALLIGIYVQAQIVLTRLYASALPEEYSAIVPISRKPITFSSVWNSSSWSLYTRVIGCGLKGAMYQIINVVVALVVFGIEYYFILTPIFEAAGLTDPNGNRTKNEL